MLTLLAALSLSLVPTDDIWVYPQASDNKDAYLRVWGAEGVAVPEKTGATEEFGFSYLKFDISSVPAGTKLKSAKLVLTHIAKVGYTEADSKKNPIEVRQVGADFSEKTWSYEMVAKNRPGELYGTAAVKPPTEEKEFEVTINLDKPLFAKDLAAGSRVFAIALTTNLSPSEGGRSSFYKFFSKDNEKKEVRPMLKLEFAD